MANITELTEVTTVAGTDTLYCVQGGNDRKCTPSQLRTYLLGELDPVTSVTGTEEIPCVQDGDNKNLTPEQLATYLHSAPVVITDSTDGLPTYGDELLTTDGWTVGSGWTESPDDTFAHTSGTATLTHSATIANASYYLLTYTITSRTAGTLSISFGGATKDDISSTGVFGPLTKGTSSLIITPTTDFNGVCVFSLKQITAESNKYLTAIRDGYTSAEIRAVGSFSLFFGRNSGRYASGDYNTAFGSGALLSLTTGFTNTAFGYFPLRNLTTGGLNCALGSFSLFNATSSYSSVGIGHSALYRLTTGNYNIGIGYHSGYGNTTGVGNISIGSLAGTFFANGSTELQSPEYSIYIGYDARGKDNDDNNSIVIGNQAIGLGANTTVLGNSSTTLTRVFGDIATGTDTPSAAIHAIKTTEQLRLGYDASNYASFTVSSAGVLTLTTSANKIALGASRTPASATDTGTAGEVCWDANYVYVCVAANTWRRAALSSW